MSRRRSCGRRAPRVCGPATRRGARRRHDRGLRRRRLRRGIGAPLLAARDRSPASPVCFGSSRGAEGEPAVEEGAVTVRNPCLSGGALEVFLEPQLPAPRLRVVGATPIAQALADLGRRLGYSSSGAGRGQRAARGRRCASWSPRTGTTRSGSSLAALRAGPLRGPGRERESRRRRQESLDLPTSSAAGSHTPAGLEIGAEPPRRSRFRSSPRSSRSGPRRRRAARSRASPPARRPLSPRRPLAHCARPSAPDEVAIDPVCGMEVAVSPASIQLERDGERFYFCSEGCRDSFGAEGAHGAAAMAPPAAPFVTGLVLAAGRLQRPRPAEAAASLWRRHPARPRALDRPGLRLRSADRRARRQLPTRCARASTFGRRRRSRTPTSGRVLLVDRRRSRRRRPALRGPRV